MDRGLNFIQTSKSPRLTNKSRTQAIIFGVEKITIFRDRRRSAEKMRPNQLKIFFAQKIPLLWTETCFSTEKGHVPLFFFEGSKLPPVDRDVAPLRSNLENVRSRPKDLGKISLTSSPIPAGSTTPV